MNSLVIRIGASSIMAYKLHEFMTFAVYGLHPAFVHQYNSTYWCLRNATLYCLWLNTRLLVMSFVNRRRSEFSKPPSLQLRAEFAAMAEEFEYTASIGLVISSI